MVIRHHKTINERTYVDPFEIVFQFRDIFNRKPPLLNCDSILLAAQPLLIRVLSISNISGAKKKEYRSLVCQFVQTPGNL